MSSWLKIAAILFALPLVAFFFFGYAASLHTGQLRDSFERGITADNSVSDAAKAEKIGVVREFDFENLCSGFANQDENKTKFVNDIGIVRECKEYQYFGWAKLGSLILVSLGIMHFLLIAAFVAFSRKSRQKLLVAFPVAWASSTLLSVLILVGQGALATVTLYYASSLLFKVYFPKLLMFIVLAVGYALYRIFRVLLSNPAPVSHEPTSEAVTEEAAPLLWQRVKEIANKLGTTPPDSILVGMSTAFYVTEFPVVHAAGVAVGRTLYLSAPMMQQLSSDEVAAIIGHEMGHFKGEDTVMTRKLSPRIIKSENTLAHLEEAGFVGMPAFYAMLVFRNLFEKTISTFKRERELAADAYGASVTSREVSASALVRYCYQSEVYDAAMSEHMIHQTKMEDVLPRFQGEFRVNDEFWKDLATHGLPHPFDSHPPMSIRLEKLGFKVEDLRFRACEKVERTAFDLYLGGNSSVIASAMQEQQHMVEHVQEQIAVKMANEDQLSLDVIAKHFPQIELKAKGTRVVKRALEGLLFALLVPMFFFAAGLISGSTVVASILGGATLLLCGYFWITEVMRWWSDKLVINYKSIYLSSWKEPVLFSSLEKVEITYESKPLFGKYYLVLSFEEKRPSLWKRSYYWGQRKKVTVNLSNFEGNPEGNGDTVLRYVTRGLAQ